MKKMEKLSSFKSSLNEKHLCLLKGGAMGSVAGKTKEKTKSKNEKGRTVDKCTSLD